MKLRKRIAASFLTLISLILIVACDTGAKSILESRESERYSFMGFLEGIKTFPYSAEQSKVSRVVEGFKKILLGMKKDDVERIMGEPDYEMFHYRPNQKKDEAIYSTWGYFLKRFERNLSKEGFDAGITLYFKPNGELFWAEPYNIDGLKLLGGAHLYPDASVPIS